MLQSSINLPFQLLSQAPRSAFRLPAGVEPALAGPVASARSAIRLFLDPKAPTGACGSQTIPGPSVIPELPSFPDIRTLRDLTGRRSSFNGGFSCDVVNRGRNDASPARLGFNFTFPQRIFDRV